MHDMNDRVIDLLDYMEDEIEDAEKYAIMAVECSDPKITDMYMSMAEDELRHFEKLGEIIKSHKDVDEMVRHFATKRHSAMLNDHAKIKVILSKAY